MPSDSSSYLDVDVHSFVDGQDAACGVMGMTTGVMSRLAFNEETVLSTSEGWPAASLVVLLLGEQKKLREAKTI
jgi:hypothetical protein